MERRQKREYRRPAMRVVELRRRTELLVTSDKTQSTGTPTYNKFNDEEDWSN